MVSQTNSTWKAKAELVLIFLFGEIQLARCIVHHKVDRRPNRQVLLDSSSASQEFQIEKSTYKKPEGWIDIVLMPIRIRISILMLVRIRIDIKTMPIQMRIPPQV